MVMTKVCRQLLEPGSGSLYTQWPRSTRRDIVHRLSSSPYTAGIGMLDESAVCRCLYLIVVILTGGVIKL
jgi:hypothetical protein